MRMKADPSLSLGALPEIMLQKRILFANPSSGSDGGIHLSNFALISSPYVVVESLSFSRGDQGPI